MRFAPAAHASRVRVAHPRGARRPDARRPGARAPAGAGLLQSDAAPAALAGRTRIAPALGSGGGSGTPAAGLCAGVERPKALDIQLPNSDVGRLGAVTAGEELAEALADRPRLVAVPPCGGGGGIAAAAPASARPCACASAS